MTKPITKGENSTMTKPIYNEDGIEITAMQKWESKSGGMVHFVVGFLPESLSIVTIYDSTLNSFDCKSSIFHRLISCPVMGDISKHLIVTQEQKDKYKVPECAEYWDDPRKCWCKSTNQLFGQNTYRVPADFTDWEPISCEVEHVGDELTRALAKVKSQDARIKELEAVVQELATTIAEHTGSCPADRSEPWTRGEGCDVVCEEGCEAQCFAIWATERVGSKEG